MALKNHPSMKNILLLFSALFLFASNLSAQTVEDAIRYSNLNVGGTARTVGVGGAFGALGAEFGAISINPAGLGMYRSSELVMTPTFYTAKTDALLTGAGTETDTKNNFNFNNVGVVFQNDGKGYNVKSSAVAIGYNRVANFNRNVYYEGETIGSFADRFVEQSFQLDAGDLNEFDSYLGFLTGALYRTNPDDNSTWTNDYLQSGGDKLLFKKQSITQTGAMNEMVFAWGANYNHKLMVGATVGIPFVSFEETKVYEEEDPDDNIEFFNTFRFEENLETSGIGINLKLGLIYRLSQMFRLGLAVHTPTGMALNDSYNTTMTYDYEGVGIPSPEPSPDGTFDYRLSTPWRAVASGAAIIGKSGFITADVEYVNFEYANFNFTSDNNSDDLQDFEDQLNTDIDNQLTSAINLRIGGEYAIKQFRLRAGYSNAGAFRDEIGQEALQSISGGLGFRGEYFYIDAAYRRSSVEETYSPYRMIIPEDGQIVNNTNNNSKFMLTLGFKF